MPRVRREREGREGDASLPALLSPPPPPIHNPLLPCCSPGGAGRVLLRQHGDLENQVLPQPHVRRGHVLDQLLDHLEDHREVQGEVQGGREEVGEWVGGSDEEGGWEGEREGWWMSGG
jgi:hypothetical protein